MKEKIIKGSLWTAIQFGSSQLLRLITNLIMTRLLFPEAFGIMAVLMTVMEGLFLFSDVGITPNLIQSNRTHDPNYINTVRTLKVVRGAILGLICLALGTPSASFYNLPELAHMIPAMGLFIFFDGLISPEFELLTKKMQVKKRALIEFAGSLISSMTIITLALFYKTPWVLIAGLYVNNIVKCLLSYLILPINNFGFKLESEALHELLHFGKWIFLATIATYFLTTFDRIFMGKALPIEWLAFYTIALNYVNLGKTLVMGISGNVLYPAYAQLLKEQHPEEARKKIKKVRRTLLLATLPFVLFLLLFGDDLIHFLYDPRYYEAGNIIKILAIGSIASVMVSTISPILLATGDSFKHFLFVLTSSIVNVATIMTGFYLYGTYGAFWGIALAQYFIYLVLLGFIHKYQVSEHKLDFAVVSLAAIIAFRI